MAEWLPTYIVTGGLYHGQTPSGDLTSFMAECQPRVLQNVLVGDYTYYYIPDDPGTRPHIWEGAFGQGANQMKTYGANHFGDGPQDLDILVFTVPNPPGAQFYKQELVVHGSIVATEDHYDNHPITLEEWTIDTFSMVVTSIYRREYATPTSVPTVTDTFFGGGAAYGFVNCRYLADGYASGQSLGTIMRNFKFFTSYYEQDDVNYLCIGGYAMASNVTTTYYSYWNIGINVAALDEAFGEFSLDENDDPNIPPDDDDPDDDPTPGPGDREKDYDPIPIPPMPELSAVGAGFITLYSPSKTLINMLADEFFSNNILDIIKNYFSSIQEMIAGLSIVPFHVPVSGYAKHKVGLFTSDTALPLVSSQFVDVDCGSIVINNYFNNFLDYSPNTKIMLWLPYIGYQEINPDEVMGNTLSIKYRCDVLSGACDAFVMIGTTLGEGAATSRIIGQFSGNVLNQVPVASNSYDEMVSSAINILTSSVGIAAGAAIGGAGAVGAAGAAASQGGGALTSAVSAQVGLGMGGTAANMIMNMKPNVVRNGTPGSTSGYMGVQKPYLIKIVPRDAVASNHIQLKGYPSNHGGTMSSLSGYCEVSEIQLNNVNASVDEINEIYNLLKGGVII